MLLLQELVLARRFGCQNMFLQEDILCFVAIEQQKKIIYFSKNMFGKYNILKFNIFWQGDVLLQLSKLFLTLYKRYVFAKRYFVFCGN